MLIKTVGRAAILCALVTKLAWGLVPLEGLVLGQVDRELQPDPLTTIFSSSLTGADVDLAQHRTYRSFIQEAQELQQSCSFIGRASYANPQSETVARRTMVATLQYVGLDATVKAIGTYARTLQMSETEYTQLADNLVKGSCSPNLSVYGLRLIKQNLLAAYKTEGIYFLPRFPGAPMSSPELSISSNSVETRELEFHHTVKNFRALCSWGGDVTNYRLLPPLISSPQVMSAVMRYMEGVGLEYDARGRSVKLVERNHLRVSCDGPICRPVPANVFQRQFPRMVGSSGLKQDLQRQWCEHFRFQNYVSGDQQSAQVRDWIKQQDLADERKDVAMMVSLLTSTSDLVLMAKSYPEVGDSLKRTIEQRWNDWAATSIKRFSRDLFFEEALEIELLAPDRAKLAARGETFGLDLAITMGELDRVIRLNDKIAVDFGLKVSRNWLRWVRSQALQSGLKEDPTAESEALVSSVSATLRALMQKGYGYFPYFQANQNLEELLAQELIRQLSFYEGRYFDDVNERMVQLPVRFHYGLFALSYVRYKALQKKTPAPILPEVAPPTAASLDL